MTHSVVDYVLAGEPEESLPELLDALADGRDPSAVLGLYYRRDGVLRTTGLRPPPADLYALPWPDKNLFAGEIDPSDDYVITAGRGCPGSCTFCQEGILHGLYGGEWFRRRSVGSIIGELEHAHERWGLGKVMINDPIFFTPKKWVMELLREYRKRIRAPFRCYGQTKWIDAEIVLALKDAGCYAVEYGFQTANDRIRREVLNRPETLADARRAFRLCDRYRLRYDVDHLFGLPGENEADFVEAARLYAECRYLNRVKVHMLVYYPGAPILNEAQRLGIADEEDRAFADAGGAGDICRVGSVRRDEAERYVRDWKNFYKLLPLLGRAGALIAVRRRWNRLFGLLPSPAVILLQLLVALMGRDHRFSIYIRYLWIRRLAHKRFVAAALARRLAERA